MAERFKACVCGHSLALFECSSPATNMDVFLVSVVCCQVEVYATG